MFIFNFIFYISENTAFSALSPAAVGWGNLFVPGLGATLRGQPATGLLEASLEIGTFYGGTFGVKEGEFFIDGSVQIPTKGNLYKPLTGQVLQEFGLKFHMYNTFYHYQQTVLSLKDTEREKDSPQSLYPGDWKDMLLAPFQWSNLSSVWVYPMILASSAYLIYDFHSTPVKKIDVQPPSGAEGLYGFSQVGAIPFGGALGEEALFRGFIQRESHLYTGSLAGAILIESSLFTLIHPDELKASAFLSGIYYGLMVHHYQGDLGPGIAAHFWVNVMDGFITYFLFRRAQGKDTPFAPPLTASIQIPS